MAKTRFVKIEDAVGMSLAHDMTQIVPATGYKGARYRKGQILAPDDLPVLRSMGKERISILELEEGDVHEDDAAARLAFRLAGEGIAAGLPVEGKVSLNAVWNGLLAYDEEILHTINSDPGWAAAALPDRVPVKKGELVAGSSHSPGHEGRTGAERRKCGRPHGCFAVCSAENLPGDHWEGTG